MAKARSRTATVQTQEKADKLTPRQKDIFGYTEGTDSSITALTLAEGGADRSEIYEKIRGRIEEQSATGLVTRNGTEKNIPNLVSTVLRQLKPKGWAVESHWKLVKDENAVVEDKPAKATKSTKAEEPDTASDAEPKSAKKRRRRISKKA